MKRYLNDDDDTELYVKLVDKKAIVTMYVTYSSKGLIFIVDK